MLVCVHENASMWALSMHISIYTTTIEGDYNINTYNIGMYNIYSCTIIIESFYTIDTYTMGV